MQGFPSRKPQNCVAPSDDKLNCVGLAHVAEPDCLRTINEGAAPLDVGGAALCLLEVPSDEA